MSLRIEAHSWDRSEDSASSAPGSAQSREATLQRIEEEVLFDRLPPDAGVVTPIAPPDERLEWEPAQELEKVRYELARWAPGQDLDLVQRTRNLLYVAAVMDVLQLPLERHVPALVFERLRTDIAQDDLIKILFWIAIHATEGSDEAIDQLQPFGLSTIGGDTGEIRQRAAIYGLKLLGRMTGNN